MIWKQEALSSSPAVTFMVQVTPVCSTVKARTSERTADLLHPNYLILEVVKWKHMEVK